jgi:hypothetical protein
MAGPGALTTVRVTYWTESRHLLDRLKELLGGASIWYRRDWEAALRRLREILESGQDRGRGAATPAGGDRAPLPQ